VRCSRSFQGIGTRDTGLMEDVRVLWLHRQWLRPKWEGG
jgi:hypothetical protein